MEDIYEPTTVKNSIDFGKYLIIMGGWGSGRRLGVSCKSLQESHLRLDVRRLKKLGSLVPGKSVDWVWQFSQTSTASVRITIWDVGIALSYKVSGSGSNEWNEKRYAIPVEWTSCHLGGSRPWFRCPAEACARRVAILYLKTGMFLCRHCHNLSYSSQKESDTDRLASNVNKIRRRLGWEEGVLNDPLRSKPKGMRWKTYYEAVEQHDDLLNQCLRSILWQIS